MSSTLSTKVVADLFPPIAGLSRRGSVARVTPGSAGDHASIHQLLTAVFHAPSPTEFLAAQDEPQYEPTDRLLIKHQQRILAHAHVTRQVRRFGAMELPTANVEQLVTLPEYRGQGLASALITSACIRMQVEGSLVGFARTSQPEFLLRRGWAIVGRPCFSSASARNILAQLESQQVRRNDPLGKQRRPLNIRLWRHIEQDALLRLHEENTAGQYGPLVRSHEYWRWLISRGAYDRIYVAIDGPDRMTLEESYDRIVGYAVTVQDQIVELMTRPDHPDARQQLLARVCSEAIERDYHIVRLHGAPDEPLHQLLSEAGGKIHGQQPGGGPCYLAKVVDPVGLLNALSPLLRQRAAAANLPESTELGLLVGRQKLRVQLKPRGLLCTAGRVGRSYLACTEADLTQLLLGQFDIAKGVETGRLEVSTRIASDAALALFPQLPLWIPPLDELPAP